jgi:WD40 repeat protein
LRKSVMQAARSNLTFRVFVSSTFSDLKAERNALQENTFPRLRAYCQKKGARFQAIDLRWGVSQEASLDQQTMNICLQELKHSQEVSPRPNFIILLGERYGWRPLPPQIEASEFETLLEKVSSAQHPFVLAWYKRDNNAIPPQYCLQPRKVKIINTQSDQEKQSVYDEESRRWNEQIEPRLLDLLLDAARKVFPNKLDPKRQKYEDSATHQEIRRGALEVEDPENHVFAYIRTIEGLPDNDSAKDYLDIKNGIIDDEAQQRLKSLKKDLEVSLSSENIYRYTAQWSGVQPQLCLQELCDRVEKDLCAVIDSELLTFKNTSELEREIQAHRQFGRRRGEHFTGRQKLLGEIQNFFCGRNCQPLVIYGDSGSGKTAIMARAAQIANETLPNAVTISRFIGATPSSSEGRSLLESLCHQIYETFDLKRQREHALSQITGTGEEAQKSRQRVVEEYSVPSDYPKLSATFRDFLVKIPRAERLILFLDALDQISEVDHAQSLGWLPDKLPENVHIVVSCLPGECLSILLKRLPQQNILELNPMAAEEGKKLLDLWLHDASRTLQTEQRVEVLDKFRSCGLPLYLRLAFEESRLWKSYTDKINLSPDVPGIIHDLLRRLCQDANHGQIMVSHSLAYIAASKNGLTEDELLDVLSLEKDVIKDFYRRSPKSPVTKSLPVVMWSRLYFDLKPFLTERTADGTSLMAFYHPQFGKVVAEEFLVGEILRKRHQELALYFTEQPLWNEEDKKNYPNLRKISELPFQQIHGELWDAIEKILCDLYFIEAKCAAGMTYDLVHDYNSALFALPEAQPEKEGIIKRDVRLKKYSDDLVVYAKGQIKTLDIVTSIEPWSEEKIRQNRERITNSPTRLDRIRAFSRFVDSESHYFVKFNSHAGFIVQQAYNSAGSGPVAYEADRIVNDRINAIFFLQLPSQRLDDNPHSPLLRILEGHTDGINCVSMTPDGKKAISGSQDKTLRLWDLERGECLRTLYGHTDGIDCVSMTPDGKKAISGSQDKTLRLWDLERGECLRTLYGHTDGINCVSMTPDGKKAVSGSSDMTVRVWNLEEGKCLLVRKGHKRLILGSIMSVNIFPHGRTAISSGSDASIRMWNLVTGECIKSIKCRIRWFDLLFQMAISHNERKAVSASSDKALRLWDLDNGVCLRTLRGHKGWILSIAVSPDGNIAITGSLDETMRVWDLKAGKCIRTFKGNSFIPLGVCITADASRAVSGGWDGTLRIFDIETGYQSTSLDAHSDFVTSMRMMPDETIAVSGSWDKTLRVWDIKNGRCLKTLKGHTNRVESMSITPDGKRLVSGGWGKQPCVWDLKGLKYVRNLKGHKGSSMAVDISPDGRRVISGSGKEVPEGFRWVLYHPKSDNSLRMWDLESGQCLGILQGHTDMVGGVGLAPDGHTAVSGSWDNTIRIWDLDNNKCLRKIDVHADHVYGINVTPDGRAVVSGDKDGTLGVWNMKSGKSIQKLEGHTGSIMSFSVTSDAKRLISASMDGTLRLWELQTGECLCVYGAPRGLCSVSEITAEGHFAFGRQDGKAVLIKPFNFPTDVPIANCVRIWRYGRLGFGCLRTKQNRSRWDDHISALCQWCGQRFPVSNRILDVIRAIERNTNLSPDQLPCLELPDEAWEEPELLSECPLCHRPLKFNPFIVDNKGRY